MAHTLTIKPGTGWAPTTSPVDGSPLAGLPRLDPDGARRAVRASLDLAPEIRAFEVGMGVPCSRGDRDELFGGLGASWRRAFVGGDLLVRAVTDGPAAERFPGSFPDYHLMPA